jgi:hypothetical protein
LLQDGRGKRTLDLRPPEERVVQRLTKPALAAGACALIITFANSVAPRQANAKICELEVRTDQLQAQLATAAGVYVETENEFCALTGRVSRAAALIRALPRANPVIGPLRLACATTPQNVEITELQLGGAANPPTLEIRASYRGREAASVVAAEWARVLAQS